MTRPKKMMLEELQRRNYAQSAVKGYLRIVREFAEHFHQPPDELGPDHLRQYQAHLFQDRKLDAGTVQQYVAALRFFFIKTLKRFYLVEDIPMPKRHRKLPEVLSPDAEAATARLYCALLSFRLVSADPPDWAGHPCREVLENLAKISLSSYDAAGYVTNVSHLVYATTLLDTLLTETTLFLFLLHPQSIGQNQQVPFRP